MSVQRDPLRVVMVIPYDPYHQPFVVRSLRFAEELVRRGHEVRYFYDTMRASKRGRRLRESLPATLDAEPCSWHRPVEFARLARAVADCDVIHFQKAKPPHSWAAMALGVLRGKPLHQDWDDDEGAFWLQAARDRLDALRAGDGTALWPCAKAALIATLSGTTEWVIPKVVDSIGGATIALRRKSERFGADKGAIFPARVGVDTDVFTPAARDEALRRQLGLDGPTVLYSGSFDVRPELDFFVSALTALVRALPSARCLMIGGGFGRGHLVRTLERAGLRDRVVLSEGLVPFADMPRYVASCDVAALPFRDNAINRGKSSLTLLECMASGLPVVTHDVGDIGWMLAGGGELARPDDPDDFGARLARILSDGQSRQKLGELGRARAEAVFGWASSVDYLEKAYRHAIASHREAGQRAGARAIARELP